MRASRALTTISALSLAFAELSSTFLHELGHAVAGKILGVGGEIWPFRDRIVATTYTTRESVIVASAGPIMSLFVGCTIYLYLRSCKPKTFVAAALLGWTSWVSILEFINYLIITPIFRDGDTGLIAADLRLPLPMQLAVSILGILLLFVVGKPAAQTFNEIVSRFCTMLDISLRRGVFRFGLVPIVLSLPLIGIAAVRTDSRYALPGLFAAFGNLDLIFVVNLAIGTSFFEQSDAVRRGSVAVPLTAYAAVTALYLLVLSRGVHI